MEITREEIEKLYSEYKLIEFDIIKLQFELDNITATGITPITYGSIKSSPTLKINQQTENEAITIIEIKAKYQKLINNLSSKLFLLDKALELLSPFQRIVMTKKVIERKQYYIVCAELHISESYAKKIKKKALDKLFILFNKSHNVESV